MSHLTISRLHQVLIADFSIEWGVPAVTTIMPASIEMMQACPLGWKLKWRVMHRKYGNVTILHFRLLYELKY